MTVENWLEELKKTVATVQFNWGVEQVTTKFGTYGVTYVRLHPLGETSMENCWLEELKKTVAIVQLNWGIEQVTTKFGTHGVEYVHEEDDPEGIGYAVIGWTIPLVDVYAEIEDGTYGQLQGFRVYRSAE
jgi:hypothetical protein